MIQDNQPIYEDSQSIVHTSKKETNIQQRERNNTITQKTLDLSTLIAKDQHILQNAIQEISSTMDDTVDSDSETEFNIQSNRSTMTSISSLLSNNTNYDILLERLTSPMSSTLSNNTATATTATNSNNNNNNNSVINSTPSTTTTEQSHRHSSISTTSTSSSSSSYVKNTSGEVDWEFWSLMISNIDQAIKNKSFLYHIRHGIPSSIRGTIWPILSQIKCLTKYNNNNKVKDQDYIQYMNHSSIFEKVILQDLDFLFDEDQTDSIYDSFFKNKSFKEPLFRLTKAYANFDNHVGYSKGFIYIALPLLIHMPEEEAFSIFTQIMNDYQWKTLFIPPTEGLSRRLFQLDGILKDQLPELYQHFNIYGVRSMDYAKQWFTRLFVSRLPLECIYRLYDIFLAEGSDVLFGFTLALLQKNMDILLKINDTNEMIQYLLGDQMMSYKDENAEQFICDASNFKIHSKQLNKLAKDYQYSIKKGVTNTATVEYMEALYHVKQQNKILLDNVNQKQLKMEQLEKKHAKITQELIDAKQEYLQSQQTNDTLRQQSFDLKKSLDALPDQVEIRLKDRIQSLGGDNIALETKNQDLEEQLARMEAMFMDIKARYAQSENERDELHHRLEEFRDLVAIDKK